jgi:hypothetical protein
MSDIASLPRLAAMYLTTGHRVPDDVMSILTATPAAEPADHPLDEWECPLDATRQYGERAADAIRIPFPEY